MIDSNAFNEFSNFIAEWFFKTVNLRSWISSAWVSFFESVGSFVFVVSNESDASNFRVLFSDKEFSTEPFWLSVFVNVDWDFAVIVVEILFLFLLLVLFFRSLIGRWASGVEEDFKVVVTVFTSKFDLSSRVIDVPTVVVEEVNVFVDWWFVFTFIFDFFVEFFLQSILDTGESEDWWLVDFKSSVETWCNCFNHIDWI